MKHVKTLASLLMVLVMVFSLSATAFADQEGTLGGGSITINNAVPGQEYRIYQLLYLESYNSDANAYAYQANSGWESWLRTQTAYLSFDDQGYVTWVNNADPAAFARAAQAAAAGKVPDAAVTSDSTTVTFTGLKLGYYLVDTTLGTLCSLDTTNPRVEMEEKNAVPENVKTVEEDSTGNYGEWNDADIGQSVHFQSTITARKGAENYVFHDSMSAGLTFAGVTGITLNGSTVDASCYTISAPAADGDTFDITFTQAFCDTLAADDRIVISYHATLNEQAVVGLPGNPNESRLSYGDSSNTKSTPASQTTTYTWDLDVLKYANGNENSPLEGAKFVLLNNDKTMAAVIVNGKLTGWVSVPAPGQDGTISWPANTVLTTNAAGKIEIDGLDADTYYLHEVEAPAGYNKLKEDPMVIITGAVETDGTLTYCTVTAKVNNQSGTELPSTGGMGTTVFYVLGSALSVGAAVLLVTTKRMRRMEE